MASLHTLSLPSSESFFNTRYTNRKPLQFYPSFHEQIRVEYSHNLTGVDDNLEKAALNKCLDLQS